VLFPPLLKSLSVLKSLCLYVDVHIIDICDYVVMSLVWTRPYLVRINKSPACQLSPVRVRILHFVTSRVVHNAGWTASRPCYLNSSWLLQLNQACAESPVTHIRHPYWNDWTVFVVCCFKSFTSLFLRTSPFFFSCLVFIHGFLFPHYLLVFDAFSVKLENCII